MIFWGIKLPLFCWLPNFYLFYDLKHNAEIGYFECAECHERFIPSVKDYTFGLHTLKKRKLTCPKCGKKTWCSKRINKNIEVNK